MALSTKGSQRYQAEDLMQSFIKAELNPATDFSNTMNMQNHLN